MSVTIWTRLLLGAVVCGWFALAAAAAPGAESAEAWESAYAGEDATGKHVIGLWKFDVGAETADSSGHGLVCALEGAKLNEAGRFAGALESACGWPVADRRHRALVKNNPRLSPRGAFTIELWIKPGKELAGEYPEAFLLDKKYVAHADYQVVLGAPSKTGERALRAALGFGEDSATFYGRPMRFEPGTWYHVAFTYDGAGTGTFYVNGQTSGRTMHAGRKAIAAGTHGLSIGDRVGSLYHGFPGLIDEVRICEGVLEFRRVKMERISERACFARMESGAGIRLAVTNLMRKPLAGAAVEVGVADQAVRRIDLPALEPGAMREADVPVDTALRPDTYMVTARLTAGAMSVSEQFPVRIAARLPERFPVVMWGVYGKVPDEIERLKRIGFTHVLGLGADYARIWEAKGPTAPNTPERVSEQVAILDLALANDLVVAANLSPGHWLTSKKEYLRVSRKGEPQEKKPDVCGLNPEVENFCRDVGRSVGRAYGKHPAFGAALLHTEVRDAANPCFHPRDLEAYRKATGQQVPAEVAGKTGVDYTKLKDFPADRVIADDHPIYTYYRWYWKEGDGWNRLNTAVHEGLKSAGRADLWTWHDPAVRVAKTFGSGGAVDVISQWTYSYPDPIRIGVAADEMLAMAAGAARPAGARPQQVMSMTQIIWYRGQTAPMPKAEGNVPAYRASWEVEQPDAPFITIAPMHLREAFWTQIARPIRGIMYHGWQSLVPCEGSSGYRYTNPQTQHELARLVREVVGPLGPALLKMPTARGDVAILQSFASEMFARRGTYGWGGKWAGDVHHVLMYARLQPEVVYDETIERHGLEGYKVLVMPDCDVLTRTVARRIKAFQAAGGIVVGDDHTAPGVRPDVVLTPYVRTGRADADKAALVALAGQLRKQLEGRYVPRVDTDNPDVIPYRRAAGAAGAEGGTEYIFVVNDRREYGAYVGQHGIVMENGLPSKAVLRLGRADGFVYDLVEGREVAARKEGGALALDVDLGPCDGRLFMVTGKPVAAVKVSAPAVAQRGSKAQVKVRVEDPDGRAVRAVVPVELTVRDAEGRVAEYSGSYAAVDGEVSVTLDIAPNDAFGAWRIEARERASGRIGRNDLRVSGPKDWPPAQGTLPRDPANPVQPKG